MGHYNLVRLSSVVAPDQITTSLAELVRGEEDLFTEGDWVLKGTVCNGEPVCSLVIAPYESAPWAGAR